MKLNYHVHVLMLGLVLQLYCVVKSRWGLISLKILWCFIIDWESDFYFENPKIMTSYFLSSFLPLSRAGSALKNDMLLTVLDQKMIILHNLTYFGTTGTQPLALC